MGLSTDKNRQARAKVLATALRFQADIGSAVSSAHDESQVWWLPHQAGWRTLERPSALIHIAAGPTSDADNAQTMVLAYLITGDWSCSPQRPPTPALVLAIDMILFANASGFDATRTRSDLVAAVVSARSSLDTIMKTWETAMLPPPIWHSASSDRAKSKSPTFPAMPPPGVSTCQCFGRHGLIGSLSPL